MEQQITYDQKAIIDAFRGPSAAFLLGDSEYTWTEHNDRPHLLPPFLNETGILPRMREQGLGLLFVQPTPLSEIVDVWKRINLAPLYLFSCDALSYLEQKMPDEYPRQGYCLISMAPIPASAQHDFLGQSFLLLQFLGKLFPAIRKTSFFQSALKEYAKEEKSILALFKHDAQQACTALQALQINRVCRPKLSEILQYTVLYRARFKADLFEDAVWSNTRSANGEGFLSFNTSFRHHFSTIDTVAADAKRFNMRGLPFIAELNWLQDVLQ